MTMLFSELHVEEFGISLECQFQVRARARMNWRFPDVTHRSGLLPDEKFIGQRALDYQDVGERARANAPLSAEELKKIHDELEGILTEKESQLLVRRREYQRKMRPIGPKLPDRRLKRNRKAPFPLTIPPDWPMF
jgi:hypothetical protein